MKCTLLFFSACLIHGMGRELAKGMVAAAAGIPNTVHHYFALYDTAAATGAQALWIALAPTAFSAVLALGGALLYAAARSAAARLFALYLAGFGAFAVTAGLMLAASEGSMHAALTMLDVPWALQVTVSVTGGLLLLGVAWMLGERLQPPASTLLAPFVATMAARTVVVAPLPWQFAAMFVYSSSYWLLAVAFGYWHRRRRGVPEAPEGPVRLWMSAVALPVLLVLVARMMVAGVRLG